MENSISFTFSKITDSSGDFKGVIPSKTIKPFFDSLVEKDIQEKKIDGFRPGKIPRNIAMQNINTMEYWDKAARLALAAKYPSIVKQEEIEPVAPPDLQFTKIAYGNDVEYVLKVIFIPNFDLPDYKQIAKGIKKVDPKKTTEKEISKVMREIQIGLYREQNPKENITDTTILPALNEEVIAKLGTTAKTVGEFEKIIENNLNLQHQYKAKEKTRTEFFEQLLKEIKIKIPEVVLDTEVSLYEVNIEKSAKKMKITKEEYLKKINKTEEELKKSFREDARKRASIQLILNAIAKIEKIKADIALVQKETEKIIKNDPKANKEQVFIYVETLIINEEIFIKLGI